MFASQRQILFCHMLQTRLPTEAGIDIIGLHPGEIVTNVVMLALPFKALQILTRFEGTVWSCNMMIQATVGTNVLTTWFFLGVGIDSGPAQGYSGRL